MHWLERMNWAFLDDDRAERVWQEARRRYFDEDEPLDVAFTEALRREGFKTPNARPSHRRVTK